MKYGRNPSDDPQPVQEERDRPSTITMEEQEAAAEMAAAGLHPEQMAYEAIQAERQPVDIDALQRLYDASTPPPWRHILDSFSPPEHFIANDAGVGHAICGPSEAMTKNHDYEFIAAAHNAMPSLLSELRSSRQRIADLELSVSGDGVRMGLVEALREKREECERLREELRGHNYEQCTDEDELKIRAGFVR